MQPALFIASSVVAQALHREGFRILPFVMWSEPAAAWVAG
jgi:hypothetical protein